MCAKGVITTEYAPGVAIDNTADLPQDERDYIGTQLLRVTLRELFEFRFMQASFFFILVLVWATRMTRVLFTTQTDPNFANFLYDSPTRRLTLIDFGAAKEFPKKFVDDYMRMVVACAERDRETLIDASVALGFLTGDESPVLMVSLFLIIVWAVRLTSCFVYRMRTRKPGSRWAARSPRTACTTSAPNGT